MGLLPFLVNILPAMNAVYLGGTATFTCDVTVPEPFLIHNYTWTAPESVVRDGRYRLLENRRVLMIADVTYEEDNGFVTCNAFLNSGNRGIEAKGTIRVIPPGEDLPTTKRIRTTTITATTIQKTTSELSASRNPPTTSNVKPQTTQKLISKAVPIPSKNPPSAIPTTAKITTEHIHANISEVEKFTESTEMPDILVPKEDPRNLTFPSISVGGAVLVGLGIIIVAVVLFFIICYLKKDNEKPVMRLKRNNHGGSGTRVLLYKQRQRDEVSTCYEPSKQKQRNKIIVDNYSSNNSPPHRERMYTPKTNNGGTKHLKVLKQNDNSYEDMKSPTPSVGRNSFGTAYEQMSRSSNQKRAYKTASNYSIISSTSYDNITPISVHSEDELRNSSGISSENSFKINRASQDNDNDIPQYSEVRKPDRNANLGQPKPQTVVDYGTVNNSIVRTLTPVTAV